MKRAICATCFTSSILLTSCGGGSGGGSDVPGQNIGGVWNGSITQADGKNVAVAGLVTEEGVLRLIRNDNGLIVGNVYVSGSDVAGDVTEYSRSPLGVGVADVSISGTVAERQSLSGFILSNGSRQAVFNLTYDAAYEKDSSLGTIGGTYTDTGSSSSLTFNSNQITGQIFGCPLIGFVSVPNPEYNVYSLSLSVGSCGASSGEYNGLATLTTDNGAQKLSFHANSSKLVYASGILTKQ